MLRSVVGPTTCGSCGVAPQETPDLVHAAPGEKLTLRFHFPAGSPAGKVYTEMVGKPGLSTIVTVDRETHYFLGVKFRHGP